MRYEPSTPMNAGPTSKAAGTPYLTVKCSSVQHSNIRGGWSGTGNINADPLFVDITQSDFRLKNNSPCIDVGLDAFLLPDIADLNMNGNTNEQVPNDLASLQRINGTAVDMGAFEKTP